MRLWQRLFPSKEEAFRQEVYEDVLQIALVARQAIDGGADPRENADIHKLFTLLWQDDLLPLLMARAALFRANAFAGLHLNASLSQIPFRHELQQILKISYGKQQGSLEAYFIKELSAFIRAKTLVCPSDRAACYDSVIAGLRASLYYNMQELRLSEEVFPIAYLNDGLHICLTLQAVETQDICCELLVSAREAIAAERDGPRIPPLEQMRRDLCLFLASLPPERIPAFWQMLVQPHTSEDAWQVVAKMRQPRAVPFLLNALPSLPNEGKRQVIVTLQNLNDTRAVPALQYLAQDKNTSVASLARTALASILQHSRSDAALLLRATDSPHAGQTGETLLRAAEAAPDVTPPAELLRPGMQAVNAFTDKPV